MEHKKTQRNDSRGVALLPLVFVFAGLVVTVALAFSAISIAQSIAVESEFGAARALHYAEAGQNDALMRLSRDKNYRTTVEYAIPFGTDGCTQSIACVFVTIDETASGTPRVSARGVANTNVRVLERLVHFDEAGQGAHTQTTWCEEGSSAAGACPQE